MGNFFEFIMNNLFLVIIIISGIIGFLSSNKEEQKKQQQRKTQQQRPAAPKPKPRSQSTLSGPKKPEHRQKVYQTKTKPKENDLVTTASITDEQRAQMERLERKYGVGSADISNEKLLHSGLEFRKALQPIKDLSEEQRVLKKDIRKSLKNKGLINGIIMAEVLGKPRSLKPYESATLERYKK